MVRIDRVEVLDGGYEGGFVSEHANPADGISARPRMNALEAGMLQSR